MEEMETHDLEDLTLSEIRDNFHIICKAIQIGTEKYVEEKSKHSQLDQKTKDEWEEMVLSEWIQQAQDELELDFVKEENLIQ